MKRGASGNIPRGNRDLPATGVGSKVFSLGVERSVFSEPGERADGRQWHLVTVDVNQYWSNLFKSARTNQKRFIEQERVRLTCCDGNRLGGLKLVEPSAHAGFSKRFGRPDRLSMADVHAVYIPNDRLWRSHSIAATVQRISR